MALDLIRDADGDVLGVTALEMETGEVHILQAKATLLATGGAGRIFAASTNAFINTGDGLGMAARAGIPLEDMEFWQFHPTGVAGAGVLLTEGCRGEGAILRNSNGERFMERYAPTLKDLAPRDFVSRCMDQEIKEGRGCGPNKDYIVLDMTHLGAETIMKRLPCVLEIGHNFANVDITREPIPVVPTIHYQMGGIPTNIHGQVVAPKAPANPNSVVNGLYAVGECACVSVHGANRLGTNSLLDLLVFGRAAGNHIVESALKAQKAHKPLPADAADFALARLARLDSDHRRRVRAGRRRRHPRRRCSSTPACSAPQAVDGRRAWARSRRIAERVGGIGSADKSQGLQHRARRGARGRQPDRGGAGDDRLGGGAPGVPRRAHRQRLRARRRRRRVPERPQRREWMKHTLWYSDGNRLDYKPVQLKPLTVESIPPKVRTF